MEKESSKIRRRQKMMQLVRSAVRKMLTGSLHQSWCVVMLCAGVVLGTVLGVTLRVNFFSSPVWLAVAGLLIILGYLRPNYALVGLAAVAGMVLAFGRVAGELAGEDYIRQLHGATVVVAGEIDGDPETDESVTKLKLKSLRFGEDCLEAVECGVSAAGSIYITAGKNEVLKRGDTVVLSGKLSEGFGTYAGYMYRPQVVSVWRPEPRDWVVEVRDWLAERIRRLIPEREAQLGLSYLLGMKTGLDDELAENLRVVGLTHIVVASGAHLSILVEVARKILGRVSRFAGLLGAGLFVLFFMALVGWTPSILRAGVMTLVTLVAWYVGRKLAPWRIILLVMAGTLLINPMFVQNLGWLLSFASFGGIMILGPKLTQFFYGEKKPGWVASTVLTTVAATVMTLPIVLYYYGQVSLISVAANLLILPTLPWAMGLVFLAGVVAGVPGVEVAVGWVATKMLDFHIAVVGWFGGMEQFLVKTDAYQGWVWWIYVPVMVLLVVSTIWRRRDRMEV